MKKLLVIVFAVVLFSSCSQEQEPQPQLGDLTMFGVWGFSGETADLYSFTVFNSTRSVYVKFKADAESYHNIYMNTATVNPWGNTYYSAIKNNNPNLFYQIAWQDSDNSFSFSWAK